MALILTGCATQRGFPPINGIANFDRVDEKVFRGAQPRHESIDHLAFIGIKTIINLRAPEDTAPFEPIAAQQAGIVYKNVPLNPLSAPTQEQISQIMEIIETSPGPVFVHCQFGCDRTGTVCACWRIRHSSWDNTVALQEAVTYGMSDFEVGMKDFIRHYSGK